MRLMLFKQKLQYFCKGTCAHFSKKKILKLQIHLQRVMNA